MMFVAKIFFTILEALFVLGLVGSALVVILTTVDDLKELREKKKQESRAVSPLQHSASEAH